LASLFISVTSREMAEKGIKDQTKEKKMLEEWISKHGS
jgi:hypothetical protein